jgi:hypothetical protein
MKISEERFITALKAATETTPVGPSGLFDLRTLSCVLRDNLERSEKIPLDDIEAYLLFHSKDLGIRISVNHSINHPSPMDAIELT